MRKIWKQVFHIRKENVNQNFKLMFPKNCKFLLEDSHNRSKQGPINIGYLYLLFGRFTKPVLKQGLFALFEQIIK